MHNYWKWGCKKRVKKIVKKQTAQAKTINDLIHTNSGMEKVECRNAKTV